MKVYILSFFLVYGILIKVDKIFGPNQLFKVSVNRKKRKIIVKTLDPLIRSDYKNHIIVKPVLVILRFPQNLKHAASLVHIGFNNLPEKNPITYKPVVPYIRYQCYC